MWNYESKYFLDAKKLALLINKYMFYDFCRIIYISYDHETFYVTKFEINLIIFAYVPNLYVINKAYKLGI